jgi:hypothetical protein
LLSHFNQVIYNYFMNIIKSIWAVLLGFITVALLSIVTDAFFEKVGILPDQTHPDAITTWMLVLALLYRSLYTVLGGYLTARLAPSRPMRHVYVLMGLGLIGGVAGAITGWSYGNHWYPVLLAITGPAFVWLGGRLQAK